MFFCFVSDVSFSCLLFHEEKLFGCLSCLCTSSLSVHFQFQQFFVALLLVSMAAFKVQGSQLWSPRQTRPPGRASSRATAGGRVFQPTHLGDSESLGPDLLKFLKWFVYHDSMGSHRVSRDKCRMNICVFQVGSDSTCGTSSSKHSHKDRSSWQAHVAEAASKLWDGKTQ